MGSMIYTQNSNINMNNSELHNQQIQSNSNYYEDTMKEFHNTSSENHSSSIDLELSIMIEKCSILKLSKEEISQLVSFINTLDFSCFIVEKNCVIGNNGYYNKFYNLDSTFSNLEYNKENIKVVIKETMINDLIYNNVSNNTIENDKIDNIDNSFDDRRFIEFKCDDSLKKIDYCFSSNKYLELVYSIDKGIAFINLCQEDININKEFNDYKYNKEILRNNKNNEIKESNYINNHQSNVIKQHLKIKLEEIIFSSNNTKYLPLTILQDNKDNDNYISKNKENANALLSILKKINFQLKLKVLSSISLLTKETFSLSLSLTKNFHSLENETIFLIIRNSSKSNTKQSIVYKTELFSLKVNKFTDLKPFILNISDLCSVDLKSPIYIEIFSLNRKLLIGEVKTSIKTMKIKNSLVSIPSNRNSLKDIKNISSSYLNSKEIKHILNKNSNDSDENEIMILIRTEITEVKKINIYKKIIQSGYLISYYNSNNNEVNIKSGISNNKKRITVLRNKLKEIKESYSDNKDNKDNNVSIDNKNTFSSTNISHFKITAHFSIDLTSSNGEYSSPMSLHYVDAKPTKILKEDYIKNCANNIIGLEDDDYEFDIYDPENYYMKDLKFDNDYVFLIKLMHEMMYYNNIGTFTGFGGIVQPRIKINKDNNNNDNILMKSESNTSSIYCSKLNEGIIKNFKYENEESLLFSINKYSDMINSAIKVNENGGLFENTSNNEDNDYYYSVDKILSDYNTILPHVKFHGPTNISPIINNTINYILENTLNQTKKINNNNNNNFNSVKDSDKSKYNPNNYHILYIILDNPPSDLKEVINSIVKASSLPLSIILLGVGNSGFGQLEDLFSKSNNFGLFDMYNNKALRENTVFYKIQTLPKNCDFLIEKFKTNSIINTKNYSNLTKIIEDANQIKSVLFKHIEEYYDMISEKE